MEQIAKFEINGVDPVIMTYSNGQYTVTYGEQSETENYYNDAEKAFKAFVDVALDDYR